MELEARGSTNTSSTIYEEILAKIIDLQVRICNYILVNVPEQFFFFLCKLTFTKLL